jgi:hypothetical protein
MEKTATGLLEQRLNRDRGAYRAYEVLNFGISNFGVGQYLLVWENYVSSFNPDQVVIFVANLHFARTVHKYKSGTLARTKDRRLWVRPTFQLQDDALIREPAGNFDEYVRLQQQYIKRHGHQFRHRSRSFLATLSEWSPYSRLEVLQNQLSSTVKHGPQRRPPVAPDATFLVNLRIIRELKDVVEASGATLAVIDAFRYFDNDPATSWQSNLLESFCAENEVGYLSVSQRLLRHNEEGEATRWDHDSHLNEAGNQILAEAIYDFMTTGPAD